MPKVTINNDKGLFIEAGSGFTVTESGGVSSGGNLAGFIPNVAPDVHTTHEGALLVTNYFSALNHTAGGSKTRILPDGTTKGQLKHLLMSHDGGGNLKVNITSPTDSNRKFITFTNVGDSAELIWTGSTWAAIALCNVSSGGKSTPTIGSS